ncbi:hypothetical protein DAPPUDRAFT_257087 [Daphnia pulex]|uniref:Uncharacterized protein n=1 Tax=Daphnia pulex TaxID=6669 RepID=E9HCS1_DAPPU|nr:hypothetical protein DAPPUDRAFT_257087 [Daphnia pulex]|eukprot:EFX70467.1 hypothetical protein DAPPUDRAFT_257087 [Daphnia pulex]
MQSANTAAGCSFVSQTIYERCGVMSSREFYTTTAYRRGDPQFNKSHTQMAAIRSGTASCFVEFFFGVPASTTEKKLDRTPEGRRKIRQITATRESTPKRREVESLRAMGRNDLCFDIKTISVVQLYKASITILVIVLGVHKDRAVCEVSNIQTTIAECETRKNNPSIPNYSEEANSLLTLMENEQQAVEGNVGKLSHRKQ